MDKNNTLSLRAWTLGLCLASLVAGFLIANVNALDISLIYLALFLVVVGVGLLTNPWGGLAASGIAVFALVLLNQFVGIYPVQNRIVNIASELAVFLAAGLLAGWFSQIIERGWEQIKHWIGLVEAQSTHDPVFYTLKPEWSKIRLEEEVLRAKAYARPLSVAVLQLTEPEGASRQARLAALKALVRIARSSTQAPAIVSYLGENRVLVILPEHSCDQARVVLSSIQARAQAEKYFPDEGQALGERLGDFGKIHMSIAGLDPGNASAESLLQAASANLSEGG